MQVKTMLSCRRWRCTLLLAMRVGRGGSCRGRLESGAAPHLLGVSSQDNSQYITGGVIGTPASGGGTENVVTRNLQVHAETLPLSCCDRFAFGSGVRACACAVSAGVLPLALPSSGRLRRSFQFTPQGLRVFDSCYGTIWRRGVSERRARLRYVAALDTSCVTAG